MRAKRSLEKNLIDRRKLIVQYWIPDCYVLPSKKCNSPERCKSPKI